MKRLLPYFARQRGALGASVLFAVIASGAALFIPYYSGRAVDFIMDAGNVDFQAVANILLLLMGMFLASALCNWLVSRLSNAVAYRVTCALRQDTFDKLQHMPVAYYDTKSHGDLMSRLTNDIDAVSDGVLQGLTQFLMGIVMFTGSLILMFRLNVFITLVIVILTPFAFLVSSFIVKRSGKYFRKQSEVTGELNGYAEEIISSAQLVKSYSLETDTAARFEAVNETLYDCGQKAQWYSSLVNPTTRLINNIVYVAVGITGSFLALNGDVYIGSLRFSGAVSVGLIASFLTYASQFARPINDITSITTQLQSAAASLKRIFSVLDAAPEADDANLPDLKAAQGRVEFQDITFSYQPDQKLIEHLSFSVRPGTTTAIVGTTGAGKTTLINLLLRFYEPDGGTILIDGTDIAGVNRDSLRRSFSMVLQDAVLFEGTIAENIGYGIEGASMEDITAAAKAARVHKAIMNLQDGYDTVLGAAAELSGGQKQLITIARAMLVDAKMLILDEATSSVDTVTELDIQQAFQKLMAGRTSFVIAHRLSTIRTADNILVMDQGSVVEQGTHEALLRQNGTYRKIYESQFAAE